MRASLIALVLKEFRQTIRDRRTLAVLLLAPLLQLLVFGYAVNLDVTDVQTVVVDEDHTAEARDFLADLTAGDAFEEVGYAPTGEAAAEMLQRGEVTMAVIVPRGFHRTLVRGERARVQILVDGGDANRAMVAQNNAQNYVVQRALDQLQERIERAGRRDRPVGAPVQISAETRFFYNPSLDSRMYFVPGVAATVLLIVVILVTALGLAREKEVGTLEQVLVTPIRPSVLTMGKTIPYAIIGLLDLALVLVGGVILFDVPFRGSILLTFTGGILYVLNILGLGLLLSTRSRNQQQAFVAAMFVTLPAILLGGFLTPIENMPSWLQPVTIINPVRHFIEILRAVLIKSASWADVAPQLVMLGGLGLAIFIVATGSLRHSWR